jgi:hypothetical protein
MIKIGNVEISWSYSQICPLPPQPKIPAEAHFGKHRTMTPDVGIPDAGLRFPFAAEVRDGFGAQPGGATEGSTHS